MSEIYLRRERRRRGWSLVYVSGLTRIAPSDLSRMERHGDRLFPGWRRRLALAFGMSERVLFAPAREDRRGVETARAE